MDGVKQGQGRSYVVGGPNVGHLYSGEFKNDKYEGEFSEYRWPDGDVYRG